LPKASAGRKQIKMQTAAMIQSMACNTICFRAGYQDFLLLFFAFSNRGAKFFGVYQQRISMITTHHAHIAGNYASG
jgi:hypothetical protein